MCGEMPCPVNGMCRNRSSGCSIPGDISGHYLLKENSGVFFREFTKFNAFDGATTLAFVHTHYFALGMIMFLLLLVLEKTLRITDRSVGRAVAAYHVGLNATALMLVVRGVPQVLGIELARGMDAAISGIAGLGHIVLGVSIVLILLGVKRAVARSAE